MVLEQGELVMFGRSRFGTLLVMALSTSALSASAHVPPVLLTPTASGKRKQKLPPKKLHVKGHQHYPRPNVRRT